MGMQIPAHFVVTVNSVPRGHAVGIIRQRSRDETGQQIRVTVPRSQNEKNRMNNEQQDFPNHKPSRQSLDVRETACCLSVAFP
jgi:hypothetical protein